MSETPPKKRAIEVHWSDEHKDAWHWHRRVLDTETDERAILACVENYQRKPVCRHGEALAATFRVVEVK